MSAEDGKHIETSDHHYHPHPLSHNGMSQGDADSQQPVMGFPPPLSPNNNASAPPNPYLPPHPAAVYPPPPPPPAVYPPQHPTVYPPQQPAPYPPTVINEINIGNPGVGTLLSSLSDGYVYAEARPVLVQAKPSLPCCGIGIGWFLFIIGWFLCAIPWYAGAMVLLCSKIDPREKSGLTACTIMAIIITIAATITGIKK